MSHSNLPSLNIHDAVSCSSGRSLPPLSELLNSSSTTTIPTPTHPPTLAPVSPIKPGATELQQHSLLKNQMKTPIRLPSFESLNLQAKSESLSSSSNQLFQSKTLPQISPVGPSSHILQPQQLPLPSQQHQYLPPQPPQQSQSQTQHQSTQESPLIEKRSYAFISHSPSTYPSQEPSIDNAQLARRKRRRTTPRELAILHEQFDKGSTPNRARRIEIAKKVDMTEKAVQIWFQNRRQTIRRQSTAEREVHHIEPIYSNHNTPVYSTPLHRAIISETPIRQQPIVFSVHGNQRDQNFINNFSSEQPQTQTPRSPQRDLQTSSPNRSTELKNTLFQPILATPARTPKSTQTRSPTSRSTLTFKLTKSPASSKELKLISTSPTQVSMTPVIPKHRQKPIMKVNPSPPRNFKNDIESNKENIPVDIKTKFTSTSNIPEEDLVYLKERKPLGELKYNNKIQTN